MPNSRPASADSDRSPASGINFDLALIVCASPVNRVVVSRIAERTGLKVLARTPDTALAVLRSHNPGTVILDGGPDDSDCDMLLADLSAMRGATAERRPFAILLSSGRQSRDDLPVANLVDAVVAKPITPDRLTPLIRAMLDRVRD